MRKVWNNANPKKFGKNHVSVSNLPWIMRGLQERILLIESDCKVATEYKSEALSPG
jgi:hypothetical protein